MKIDTHHHALTPEYLKIIDRLGIRQHGAAGVPIPDWSVDGSLRLMDERGIQAAVLAIGSPGVHFGNDEQAKALARVANDSVAKVVADHPSRFGAFATIQLPNVDDALAETAYALDTLGFDGVNLLASVDDKFLGDPRFEPLLAELDRRHAVAFVHPHLHSSSGKLGLGAPETLFEFIADTSRAILNLLWTGSFERYPNIRWIFSHAGGALPFLAWRWELAEVVPQFRQRSPKGARAYLSKLYLDTTLSPTDQQLGAALDLVGPSRILFGSDYPYAVPPVMAKQLADLEKVKVFDPAAKRAMESENALALFPKLAARIAPAKTAAGAVAS
jgi:predicted TIM-barrel fold metal-dependent hydrolase